MVIFAGVNGFLDKLEVRKVTDFEARMLPYMRQHHSDILTTIRTEGQLSDELQGKMKEALSAFLTTFNQQ